MVLSDVFKEARKKELVFNPEEFFRANRAAIDILALLSEDENIISQVFDGRTRKSF